MNEISNFLLPDHDDEVEVADVDHREELEQEDGNLNWKDALLEPSVKAFNGVHIEFRVDLSESIGAAIHLLMQLPEEGFHKSHGVLIAPSLIVRDEGQESNAN